MGIPKALCGWGWAAVLTLTSCLLVCSPAGAAEPWGTDTNAGDGPKLIEAAAPALVAIIKASPEERTRLIEAYAAGAAADQIEAVKRFRNPELRELYIRLASHADWKIRHRALHVLEYYGAAEAVPLAFAALNDKAPRLREKAAITLIKLWSPRAAGLIEGDPQAIVADALDAETNPHVVSALTALESRLAGKLLVRQVYREHTERRPDGLTISPFLSGMPTVSKVAPGYTKKGISEGGGSSASKLPEGPWTAPIILFGEEARSGLSLQPFANLRGGDTTYHTGLDCGACLDGAGYYALAPGVVKFVYTGSDMGTEIVVQHHLGAKRVVNAVYMHGGDTIFVKGGDKVECGQLIGTMGLGYSIENGGHYAHLHFGLYPGEFATTHNYGYRSVKAGLADWYDPAYYIPLWEEITRPLVSPHRSRRDLGKAAALLAADKPGDAFKEADSHGEAGAKLRAEIEAAVAGAVGRAEKIRDQGYPTAAQSFLTKYAKSAKDIPGAEAIATAAKAWKRDKALKDAIKGERKILSTEDQVIAMVNQPKKAVAAWAALLKTFESTCLAPRIRQMIKGVGLRE
jgi:Peptidase family M23/HEAT repeats